MAVSFTQGNDFIVPTEDAQTYLGGAGNDTYMLSDATIAANSTIVIQDTEGTNTIQLVGGLSITSSLVTSNALELTLSNGAKVQILGADSFGYDVGGNALAGVDGTDQTFTELVENTLGTTVPATGSSTGGAVEVPDSTAPATPTFSVSAATSVIEGNDAVFTVSLSSAQATAQTVNYALAGTGGAVLGTDTTTVADGTLTFAPGEVTKTVTVPVTFDSTVETGEGMTLTLSAPSTGTALAATPSAAVSFVDPPAPTFTLTSNAVAGAATEEGQDITYTITPSSITDKAYTFTLSTLGDTVGGVATAAGATDFSPASQTVTFAAGATTAQTVVQTIVNDGVSEGLEGYKTSLLDSTFAAIDSTTGLITDPTSGSGTGTVYALTTSIDNFPGTTGNDTFIGDNSGSTATVSAGDQLAGSAGTDTFKYYLGATFDYVLPTMSTIETLFLSGDDKASTNIDVSTSTDINRLVIDKSTVVAAKTYTLGAGDTFALQNTAGATGAKVIFDSADAATTVTLDTVGTSGTNGTVDLKGTNLATVTLDVANKNYIVMNNSAGATVTKTVNVTGTGSLVLDAVTTADLTGITTVNASTNKGGVTFVAPTSKLAFTGGSANDEVQFAATTFTFDDKLIGGTGTDVIQVKDTAINVTTADVVKGINASSGFETLALAATGSTVDFDMISASAITNARISVGGGAQTLTNTTNNTLVEIAANITMGANDLTIANKLGQFTTNIKLDATSTGASSVAQLVLTGVNNINIESDFSGTGAQATANTLTVKTQADNSVFTVTGDHALDLTLVSAATLVGSTVNASGLTAALNVVGTDKGDSLTGGSGKDSFIGNTDGAAAGADTFTGGEGADTFKFDALTVGTANMGTITDFSLGDKLALDLATGTFASTKIDVSSAGTLEDAVGLADGTATNVTWFVYANNTYVVTAGATVAAITDDTIVKLAGVLDLSTSTFDGGTDTLTFA
ncbi:Calx-beta domain-containing protein [Desulfobacter sp.]|uniref:beta strand repeat-containing protein n=1 Tax=Desulfobacter sp. TaxID=2294 RepID=UPI000E92CD59|nr:Calx-beta domain-containing protein [Desulfobacter sp.]HBT87669.1 hypothetical protein [Desulfobacter sp.]